MATEVWGMENDGDQCKAEGDRSLAEDSGKLGYHRPTSVGNPRNQQYPMPTWPLSRHRVHNIAMITFKIFNSHVKQQNHIMGQPICIPESHLPNLIPIPFISIFQAFINIDDSKNEAKITTTKFVRISKFEALNLEIQMVRDLLEKTNTTTVCSVKSVNTNYDSTQMVTLRKLRTGLNMLTAR